MKSLLWFLAASLLLVAGASADWVIESQVEKPSGNLTGVIKVKGDKLRVDLSDSPVGAMSSILDLANGDSIGLLHDLKRYIKASGGQGADALLDVLKLQGSSTKRKSSYHATGKMEKISGFNCEIYLEKDGSEISKCWVTKNNPPSAALDFLTNVAFKPPHGFRMFFDPLAGGVMLKLESGPKGKKETVTIVSVKEQPVEASEFEIPADYENANP